MHLVAHVLVAKIVRDIEHLGNTFLVCRSQAVFYLSLVHYFPALLN